MAYPTIYAVTYSYTAFQQSQGNNSFPGTQLDNDLAGLQASIQNVENFMGAVVRSDGALQNSIVTFDSLSAKLQTAGLAPAAAWAPLTNYAQNANVIVNSSLYRAAVPHLSGTFATDLAAARWTFVTALPIAGYVAGTGLVLNTLTFSVSGLTTAQFAANVIDTDTTLAANSDTRVASQKAVKAYAVAATSLGAVNGTATLDGTGKLPTSQIPAGLVGAVVYQGVWNASTNSPTLAPGVGTKGFYYKVSVAGSTAINGISQWNLGDTIIFDGTTWDKIDGVAAEVLSVAGQTGVVVLAKADVGLSNVDNTSDVTKNAAAATLINKTIAGYLFGQCVLAKSGANLVLSPKNGNLLTVNGIPCTVPDAGVSLAATSLTPGTLYYIYAVATAGAVSSIEASATAYAVSTTAGNKGTTIKSGDDTRTLVGMARPITGPAWSDLINQRFVRSWFNDPGVAMKGIYTAVRTTTQVLGGGTYAEPNTEIRVEFLSWTGELVDVAVSGSVANSTTGSEVFTGIAYDGVVAEDGVERFLTSNGTAYTPVSPRSVKNTLAEGYHYATLVGAVSANTASFYGAASGLTTALYGRLRL
jgi:hypothetical protein